MRLNTLPRLHHLALAAALLGTGLAQAAGLAITSGSVTGHLDFRADANGQPISRSASLADASGQDVLLGFGNLGDSLALTGSGKTTTLEPLWAASASLDASEATQLKLNLDATSVLRLGGDGNFGGGTEQTSLLLEAELAVTSTGEAAGTAVRLVFAGTADALAGSTGPLLDVTPSFDLVVRDAHSNILASWQGLDAGSSAAFRFSLDTRVGDSLWLSLSHASTSLLGSADSLSAGGDTLDTTALLSGTVQVTAVPEPGTYALLLAGLAAVGLLHQRQAQRRR
ncbi:PEP-CTERM sorting domain-containing protein [Pseudaquabacterium pictum]|uniref:Ice-binding protein C-terminal domain-containing protein n=1 Tax=Pseudaquabacterium pictum TaxID=2315236 RepID=A0A480ASJ7_9BURK|nr:PEP-CTERM sorting domain-containing protein [Rubrivivax pictus]GCL62695.1 hypothetical protein AQPW35_17760 [Rubrivivax pictus]